ncbi:M48 family metalloprotease [Limnobacter sp.]|uniref:M48 family metallopeptidase n=1 Tax=Limnobacter sp. TaxID=2003368 RepID=UPI002587F44E|nr:M48 family metalloprotease [Limnobacter sp.]
MHFLEDTMRLLRPRKWLLSACFATVSLSVLSSNLYADGIGNLPNLGDAGSSELSVQDEKKLGDLIMRDYRTFGQINDDSEITGFLNRFGAKIVTAAGASPSDFEFFLVTDKTINAFALPGGHIGVNSGLIASAHTESELASVLAHEVGHVTQRHIARMYSQQKQTSLVSAAAIIAGILLASSNPDAAQGVIAAGAGYSVNQQLSFSRDSEREADRVGFATLEAAGFNPQGMVDFFGRLQKSARLYENNAPAYLQTHPLTAERIADIRNRAGLVPEKKDYNDDPLEFELVRVKAIVVADKSPQDLNDQLRIFQEPMVQENIKNPVVLAYGRSLVLSKLGKTQQALTEVTKAIDLYDQGRSVVKVQTMPAMLQAERLRLRLKLYDTGRPDLVPNRADSTLNAQEKKLLVDLEDFRETYKGNMSVKLLYARGLQSLGLHEKAEQFLRDLTAAYRSNGDLFELAAKSAQALGKQADQHYFLAQSYAARGAYLPAIEQTQIAKRFATNDYYLLAEIDAKQREYKQKADEQREMMKSMKQ